MSKMPKTCQAGLLLDGGVYECDRPRKHRGKWHRAKVYGADWDGAFRAVLRWRR